MLDETIDSTIDIKYGDTDPNTLMRPKYYPNELKTEVVRLVIVDHLSGVEVAVRLGISYDVVLTWVKRFRNKRTHLSEVAQLKAELREIATERDVLMRLATHLLDKMG